MKTILIPTDFSSNSLHAIKYAITLFKDTPCNFYVLHVEPLSASGIVGNSFPLPSIKPTKAYKGNLSDYFTLISQLSSSREHHFIALHEYGNLVNIIRQTVVDKKIDLIVMGNKGASGIKNVIIGSNTGDVITKVHCNLLVIPEKAKVAAPKEIVFATDYNNFFSHSILEAISKMLRLCKANLKVLDVSKDNSSLNLSQKQNKNYLQDYLEELYHNSHSMHNIKNEKVKTGIEKFVAAHNIDLVIMVAKNLNFLQQLLFDSTIKKLSFHTTVPLLVLHE